MHETPVSSGRETLAVLRLLRVVCPVLGDIGVRLAELLDVRNDDGTPHTDENTGIEINNGVPLLVLADRSVGDICTGQYFEQLYERGAGRKIDTQWLGANGVLLGRTTFLRCRGDFPSQANHFVTGLCIAKGRVGNLDIGTNRFTRPHGSEWELRPDSCADDMTQVYPSCGVGRIVLRGGWSRGVHGFSGKEMKK